jgi:DNA-binding NtrC family response regulator
MQALLVEDDKPSLVALEKLVQAQGFDTIPVRTLEQARKEIEGRPLDLAILDLDLPDGSGMDLIEQLDRGLQTEIIIVTGHGSIDSAVEALHSGVVDYLTKPLDVQRFERVLASIKRTLALHREVTQLRENLRRMGRFDQLVGSSPAMQVVYDLITKVAPSPTTVLITGETGTGKDAIAETIHRMSRRAEAPFVAVNCGAIQPNLIESELFGHEPGSFTGATKMRRGLFEQADGGTLFLDEITEMPLDLQVKLLRVLERKEIYRVGGEKAIKTDVRLLAATNRSPEKAVEDGKLREDLFYRLKVFPIHVPPLRERDNDVELLAGYFLSRLNEEASESKKFEPAALDRLRTHDWPGNVREVRNVVERAFILSGDRITADVVQVESAGEGPSAGPGLAVQVGMSIAAVEKRLILATLEDMGGNKVRAAETLGISLKTLYNRLNSYGLGRSKVKA